MKKLPPIQKIYDALRIAAHGLVCFTPGTLSRAKGSATVKSLNGPETYTVTWIDDVFSSNDPATHNQGFPGYPVIAVMMKLGLLPCDSALAQTIASGTASPKVMATEAQSIYAHLQRLPVVVHGR